MITRLVVGQTEHSLPENPNHRGSFDLIIRIGRLIRPSRLTVFLLILICAPMAPVTPSMADTDNNIVHEDDPCAAPKQEHVQTVGQFHEDKAFNLIYTYVCEYVGVDPVGQQELRWTLEKLVRDPPGEECPPPTGECPLAFPGASEQ